MSALVFLMGTGLPIFRLRGSDGTLDACDKVKKDEKAKKENSKAKKKP